MPRTIPAALVAVSVFVLNVSVCLAQGGAADGMSPLEVFDQRILPIFRSPEPSSCVQCHLASVDLKSYILPSHEKTFISLRDQGLIDTKAPEKSKILELIRMGDQDVDEGARLIHEKMRKAEYEAFASWIEACCDDPELRDSPSLDGDQRAGPKKPDAVIRHARKSRVVDSFARHIWSQRMRCFPCHTPYEIDASNPRHKAAIKKQGELAAQYDRQMIERLHFFQKTPEATMQYLIDQSRRAEAGELPLINLEHPSKSLLVLKPTAKLPMKRDDGTFEEPSYAEPISHMGGLKMHPNDQSYKSFVAWIQDYADVVGDRYTSVADLPPDNWQASKFVLKLTDAPKEWPVGLPVQLFVHAWDDGSELWSEEPVAFTQGTVTPRRMVNGALFLLARRDAQREDVLATKIATLSAGRYLVKTYVDMNHRLARDPAALLGEEDLFGQAEVPKARWREGFLHGEKVSAKSMQADEHASR